MTRRPPVWRAALAILLPLAVSMMLGPATAAAAPRDRTPPTAPTNLRITGVTSYSVSLAWNPSTDRSGIASYTICCAHTNSTTVSGSATSFTFTAGVEAGRPFSFVVVARDAAGNVSAASNSVSVTTPADTTPPAQPVVQVTEIGATHVTLAWSAADDSPNLWFTIFMDGAPVRQGITGTTATLAPLDPQTSYTFTVQAQDFAQNISALSEPVSATTAAPDAGDTTPPSMPGNLRTNGMQFGDGETWLFWDASTDNQTAQALIEYRVFANGVYDHSTVGRTRTILYGNPGAVNTFTVIAVDAAGNQSPPATIVVNNF